MKTVNIIVIILICGLSLCLADEHSNIVLPNSELIGCKTNKPIMLWQDNSKQDNKTYPIELKLDTQNGVITGTVTIYDKAISIKEVMKQLNLQYGKWIVKDTTDLPVILWRVTPKKFAIQLSKNEDGLSQVILHSFH